MTRPTTPQPAHTVLTPDTLSLLADVARLGSLAAAARARGMAPSALTYRVRQVEDALDVLLFDRRSRHARPTAAGTELLREGQNVLGALDALAQRVRRVATGWEATFTIAVDSIIVKATVLDLCEKLLAQQPPTRLRLRDETLTGTLEALTSGAADLALGVADGLHGDAIGSVPLGEVAFVFAVAPHHPLARHTAPLSDPQIAQHRVVAVADTVSRGQGMTLGLLNGQDVLTVATMQDKLEAQLRGLGCGSLPVALAQPYLDSGRLVACATLTPPRSVQVRAAWRHQGQPGLALQWWQQALASPPTRSALLDRWSACGYSAGSSSTPTPP